MHVTGAIRLAGRAADSLDWSAPLIEAANQKGPILWAFDLGLDSPYFPLEEEMSFQSLSFSLSQFTQEVWPLYQEKTAGAILYAGSGDFSAAFAWSEKQRENWALWCEERPPLPERLQKRLFCADAFAYYFQMLAHRLPDEMPLYLLFDGAGCGSAAERHLLFSGERFDHFELALKGVPYFSGLIWEGERVALSSREVKEAFCFPQESLCDEAVLAGAEAVMQSIKGPFRVIPEIFLTEQWEGIDILHVMEGVLTSQGERKLKGFAAAGGEIEFRGRGI